LKEKEMTRDDIVDNLFKLLVAVISILPWTVGFCVELKRRKEKKERERSYHTHRHDERHHKTEVTHSDGEHGKSRTRNDIGRSVGGGDS
jgi:hypothetical protein